MFLIRSKNCLNISTPFLSSLLCIHKMIWFIFTTRRQMVDHYQLDIKCVQTYKNAYINH